MRDRFRLWGFRARCPYCHAPVRGLPEACPSCGLELGGDPHSDFRADGRRTVDGRRRLILIVGMGVLFVAGLAARQFPPGDPVRALREKERRAIPSIMDDVLARRFDEATAALDELLVKDDLFSEAYIVRSLAKLGQGAFADAVADAKRGAHFIAQGLYDKKAKGITEKGPALAARAQCFAEAALAVKLPAVEGAALFDHMLAYGRATTCAEVTAWQQSASPDIRQTTNHALTACPELFVCRKEPPGP